MKKKMSEYICDVCGKLMPLSAMNWITSRIGVCNCCRNRMADDDVEIIMDNEENSAVIEKVIRKYAIEVKEVCK